MRRYLHAQHYRTFHVGSAALSLNTYTIDELIVKDEPEWSFKFRVFKKLFDYGCALLALPIIVFMAAVLYFLNPFFNPGPVFFRQARAGRLGKEFRMLKFRTMLPSKQESRGPNERLEEDRITTLGCFLRKTRLDEVPNFFNVLRSEMSVVGPRPDAASHVAYYSNSVYGYSKRLRIKPGITGLAQVELGYVEDEVATAVKSKYDNLYVERCCGRLDIYIICRTVVVVLYGVGAK